MHIQCRRDRIQLGHFVEVLAQQFFHSQRPTVLLVLLLEHHQGGVPQVASQGLFILATRFIQQGPVQHHLGMWGIEVDRVTEKHRAVFIHMRRRRMGKVKGLRRQVLLYQPAAEAVTIEQRELARVLIVVCGKLLGTESHIGKFVIDYQLRRCGVLEQAEKAAVAGQGLAQRVAVDHGVTHHRPTADG